MKDKGKLIIIDKELYTQFGITMSIKKQLGLTPKSWKSAKYFSFNQLKARLINEGYHNTVIKKNKHQWDNNKDINIAHQIFAYLLSPTYFFQKM